jgi:hypothetical protein
MRGPVTFALLSALMPLACGGSSPSSGITSYLRATNAQYEPGELDTSGAGIELPEPTVDSVKSNNTTVFPGAQGRAISGSVNGAATAVLLGLSGDQGHWLLPLGIPDLDRTGNFVFSTSLSFSTDLPAGPRSLVFRGVDATGALGPSQTLALSVDAVASVPTGTLVIQLVWDTESDLDLHVRVPNPAAPAKPVDVWDKAPLALPPVASSDPPYTTADVTAAGKLLFDSNAQCVIDGQRHEEVVFPGAYAAGEYEVRVDTFSLCGEPTAHWHVAAYTNMGTLTTLAEATGQSTDRDTVSDHDATAGVLAFKVTPP